MTSSIIKLEGSNYFRIKIAYSLLLSRPIEISNIRTNSINPGLNEAEISFLQLIEQITNGSLVEISKTGTILKFTPGVITNNYGDEFRFECDNSRCLSYYLEGILPIAMYGKESLKCILIGVTNNSTDISCDTFRNTTVPLIQKLVIGDTISLDIKKRGVFPIGKGEVKFLCPIITYLNNFDWEEPGKVKKIRGTAFSSKIPGTVTTRMVDACRGVFNNFIPDVWIAVDNYRNKEEEM
jgi:RNA 3'-terminal phosphate cyclase-like protein